MDGYCLINLVAITGITLPVLPLSWSFISDIHFWAFLEVFLVNHVLINPDDEREKKLKISRSNVLRRDEKIEGTFSLYIRKFWMDRLHADKYPLIYSYVEFPLNKYTKKNFRVIFVTKVQTVGKNRLFKTNIQRNEIARPQTQFLHSCFCERLIYAHDRSAYSAAGK